MSAISCLALFIVFVGVTRGYEITSETRVDEFPVQIPNYNDDKTFFRILNRTRREEIACPWGYVFDLKENHCVKTTNEVEDTNVDGQCLRLGLPEGDHSNPNSCETFYTCDSVCCYLMHCSAHLLFNVPSDSCLYPNEAGCCEYVEKNSNRIVQ